MLSTMSEEMRDWFSRTEVFVLYYRKCAVLFSVQLALVCKNSILL